MYDHRSIAKAMNLFHFEEHSPGMVFWHPMGLRVFRTIEDFMRHLQSPQTKLPGNPHATDGIWHRAPK